MRIRPGRLPGYVGSARGAGPGLGFRGVACLLALVMLAGLAHPGLAAGDEAAETQAQLRRAAAAADLGNYPEAAKAYEAAYMTSSDPNLLVHVGQTWQLAGDRQKALTAFRSYLRLAPNGEQRAFCEAKLRELEGQGPAAGAPWPGAMGPPLLAVPPPSAPPPIPAPLVVMPAAAPPPPAYAAQPAPAPATTFAAGEARAPAAESPVYHRWPFWIVVGTVVIAGTALAIWYTRDRDLAMPITTFGTRQF